MPSFLGKSLMLARRLACQSLYEAGVFRAWAGLAFDSPCYIVLCYHGVSDTPHALFTSLPLFDRHLAMMRRWGTVTTLDEMGSFLSGGVAPPGPKLRFIITFDDGYANVARNAAPVLRKHQVKATVFINPGWIAANSTPWWFRLNGLGPIRQVLNDFPGSMDACGQLVSEGGDHLPEPLVNGILSKVLPEDFAQWWQELCNSVPAPPSACCEEAALADWKDLAAVSDVLDVGSHTLSHTILGASSDPQYGRNEVLTSKLKIEQELGKPCPHFAYPRGASGDFNEITRTWLIEAGHQTAVTTRPGVTVRGADAFEVPRFYVTETPTGELAANIVGALQLWDKSVDALRGRLLRKTRAGD